ncbi:helix-turn-helix transcriptional regulator [Streptomyces sp. NPDC058268]|uniref:helix-turn-helix transcriptional regulator n=1 Tax=Streptomyces sp. NPDC058268 TaxID=3346413 RepID=UPI0036E3DD89
MSDLFDAVDAFLAEEPDDLPPPATRRALREAAGRTQEEVALALGVARATVNTWEKNRNRPQRRNFQAYRRLLKGWAAKYPHALSTTARPRAFGTSS